MADKIVEMQPKGEQLAIVQKDSSDVEKHLAKITSLGNQIASMRMERRSRSPKPFQKNRSRSEFFDLPTTEIDPETFVTRSLLEELRPITSKTTRRQKIFVHKDLRSCSHVFVRVNRVKKALEPPYEGPYPVLGRSEKYCEGQEYKHISGYAKTS
ncbi:hypothetical protein HNY73_006261 [Argiope bruennichi]|uniref:Uncharacterized protein n=1 Tax=Argiope bruennichi TaxID=94029 RepID=A0A8T0FRP9_ARGBR|nr:hypothetical protein HNY73_006261 [Argiope bruennichi]